MTADVRSRSTELAPEWAPRLDPDAVMYSLTDAGAAGRNIPRPTRLIPLPDLPLNPVLSLGMCFSGGTPPVPSILDTGEAVFTSAGRMAIALALEHMGVKAGERILMPAYHCIVMVEALSHVQAVPSYYRLRDDLSPDYDDLDAKVDGTTRALLLPHYFGFPQDMSKARRFCDDRGIKLIEDCAHAFFGARNGQPLGSWGDYAIGSVVKFFPASDGGFLVSRHGGLRSLRMTPQGMRATLGAVDKLVTESVRCGRLPALRPLLAGMKAVKRGLRGSPPSVHEGALAQSVDQHPDDLATMETYSHEQVHRGINAASNLFRKLSSSARNAARRRRNYMRLRDGLAAIPGCRPVFDGLSDGTVPFECAMWLDDMNRVFPKLEDLAVPMHRFGQFLAPDMDESVCPVAAAHSHHGVQFACHQDLTVGEIDTIVARVRHAMSA
jgi:dTDP-4-amino-4,6-dideoxygalactose transaminase